MSLTLAEKRKSLITSFSILFAYVFVFQLSGLLLQIPAIADFVFGLIDAPDSEKGIILTGWWNFSFGLLTLGIVFILATADKKFFNIFDGEKASTSAVIGWGIIGFFLVLIGQYVGAILESVIGIQAGSENTAVLVEIAKLSPVMIIVIAVIGPILEEFVFRRVIFGTIIQFQNFWISAIISALVFAAIHFDFTHLLLYTITGVIFAFLYYKTKRLLAPILAHVFLNTFVTVMQLNIEKIRQFVERVQQFLNNMPQ